MVPEWIWLVFVFAFGGCIGSFLNVVVYRLPRDKSLVTPPSACPSCGMAIMFYDNIPLVSWLVLRGRCRYCKKPISVRYFVVELITAVLFVGVFVMYFVCPVRQLGIGAAGGAGDFMAGGWLLYVVSVTLLAGFLAASAIDMEHWLIPLSLCWFVTGVGIVASSLAGFVIAPDVIVGFRLFPRASASVGAMTAGAAVGLGISLSLLAAGCIKQSYESSEDQDETDCDSSEETISGPDQWYEADCNHRGEMLKEMVFLLPVVVCGLVCLWVFKGVKPVNDWWVSVMRYDVISGLLGGVWGYFVGCGVVWLTRILGTLAFGKEAMGLGDVHLMGAAGAVVGPLMVVVAFFVAPFFGLGWAFYQMFFRKTRQIPYGPFLSLGVFVVMIFHDRLRLYFSEMCMSFQIGG